MSSSTELTPQAAPEASNQLDEAKPADPSQHKEEDAPEETKQPEKKQTRMDALEKASKEAEGDKEAEPDGKAEKKDESDKAKEPTKDQSEEKGDKAEGKKDADDPAAKDEGDEKAKHEASKKHPEAPANFLPRAKELWRNVPNEVKSEIARITQEHEEKLTANQEANERYEAVRPYDELARKNGGDLKQTMERVHHLETMMQTNPLAALNQILLTAGPRKNDGQPLSLFEVAQFIVNQGQEGYQRAVAPPQQQRQPNGEVEALRSEIEAMKLQSAASQIIEPFRAAHPRYDELQDDIALFLKSGKIPTSLTPPERLAAAYDMAVRVNPVSNVGPGADREEPASSKTSASSDSNGQKSVRGSPVSGVDTKSRRKGPMSRKEAINSAIEELGLS